MVTRISAARAVLCTSRGPFAHLGRTPLGDRNECHQCSVCCEHSWFSQTHKIGNIGIIANFVFPEICSFLLYLHYMMLVNVKLDVNGSKRITFEDYEIHCSCSFLMVQLKQSWQYWHSCIAESL